MIRILMAGPWFTTETIHRAIWPIVVSTDRDGVRHGEVRVSASARPLLVSTPAQHDEPSPEHPARRLTELPSLPHPATHGTRHCSVCCTAGIRHYCSALSCNNNACTNAKTDNHTLPTIRQQPALSHQHMTVCSAVVGLRLPAQLILPMWSPARTCA